ncbi:hypothetical protein WL56_05660 [Burkholderia cepacia]|nr:hypothetical protein WL56_05660 [Burkholderia cepacia]
MLPEVQGYPELAEFLRSINAASSTIESVGCEKWSREDVSEQQKFWTMSCYVDVIFSDLSANEEPQNLLRLATRLAASMEGCESWWASLELGLQRLRAMAGGECPWGLLIRVSANGRTEDEARRLWGHSLGQLQDALARG